MIMWRVVGMLYPQHLHYCAKTVHLTLTLKCPACTSSIKVAVAQAASVQCKEHKHYSHVLQEGVTAQEHELAA